MPKMLLKSSPSLSKKASRDKFDRYRNTKARSEILKSKADLGKRLSLLLFFTRGDCAIDKY